IGLNPNLEEVRVLSFGMIELAVHHTLASAHSLNIPGWNAFDVAHAVFVRQVARQHIADDFHVFVAMSAKAGAGGNAVFVDDAQIAPAHEFRVVITSKRKAVKGLEPTMVGITTFCGTANLNHKLLLLRKTQ
ncbi:MAG: hypothetical protein RIS02_1519, partial [Pseudomonadota bacterium]